MAMILNAFADESSGSFKEQIDALVYLAENCQVPLFCDPVSTVKAEKLRPILHRIHTLKPNRLEAELLSGVPIREKADVPKAAQALLNKGVQRLFISLGSDGVFAAEFLRCHAGIEICSELITYASIFGTDSWNIIFYCFDELFAAAGFEYRCGNYKNHDKCPHRRSFAAGS